MNEDKRETRAMREGFKNVFFSHASLRANLALHACLNLVFNRLKDAKRVTRVRMAKSLHPVYLFIVNDNMTGKENSDEICKISANFHSSFSLF